MHFVSGASQGDLLFHVILMTSDIRRFQFSILNVEIFSKDVQTVSSHSMHLHNGIELSVTHSHMG